jgi:hypothetical protein
VYTLGLVVQKRDGHLVIRSLYPSIGDVSTRTRMIGWHLLAIRRANGTILDVVERHADDVWELIRSSTGPLESDQLVNLELLNGVTFERRTVD